MFEIARRLESYEAPQASVRTVVISQVGKEGLPPLFRLASPVIEKKERRERVNCSPATEVTSRRAGQALLPNLRDHHGFPLHLRVVKTATTTLNLVFPLPHASRRVCYHA